MANVGERAAAWMVLLVAVAGAVVVVEPRRGPLVTTLAVFSVSIPLALAWRRAAGTALRPALAWAGVSLGLGLVAGVLAVREPWELGRPWAGQAVYLEVVATLAAGVAVLNARRPGSGAWAILTSLLVVLFLLPWLEGTGLSGRAGAWDRLRMESPWTLFFGLLALAVVANYLPTRHGPAAMLVAVALGLWFLGMTRTGWERSVRGRAWLLVPILEAAAAWLALARGRRREGETGLDRLWLWFRDAWGVVWALRTQERFNRTAQAAGWPIRLGWRGVEPAPGVEGSIEVPPEALATLRTLLRRFAEPERLDRAAGGEG